MKRFQIDYSIPSSHRNNKIIKNSIISTSLIVKLKLKSNAFDLCKQNAPLFFHFFFFLFPNVAF